MVVAGYAMRVGWVGTCAICRGTVYPPSSASTSATKRYTIRINSFPLINIASYNGVKAITIAKLLRPGLEPLTARFEGQDREEESFAMRFYTVYLTGKQYVTVR
jgi:hypothetical protein